MILNVEVVCVEVGVWGSSESDGIIITHFATRVFCKTLCERFRIRILQGAIHDVGYFDHPSSIRSATREDATMIPIVHVSLQREVARWSRMSSVFVTVC